MVGMNKQKADTAMPASAETQWHSGATERIGKVRLSNAAEQLSTVYSKTSQAAKQTENLRTDVHCPEKQKTDTFSLGLSIKSSDCHTGECDKQLH